MKKDGHKTFKTCCTTVEKKAVSRVNQFNSIKRLFSMNDLKKFPSKLAEATKKRERTDNLLKLLTGSI